MSEQNLKCTEIESWILEPVSQDLPPELNDHLTTCSGCKEQVWLHQSLVAAFVEEAVPELSSSFEAGLEKKLAGARLAVTPLAGWRRVAMIGYAAVATAFLAWALRDVPLPTIDISAPWVLVGVFLAVPLTLLLAVAASRWLPAPTGKVQQQALVL